MANTQKRKPSKKPLKSDKKNSKSKNAGAPPIYAELTSRPTLQIPVSVKTGIKELLDIYKNKISELKKIYSFKYLSDIDDQEIDFPTKDCWTWIQSQIIESQQYDYIESPVSAGSERTSIEDLKPVEKRLEEILSLDPETDYITQVTGDSMVDVGIENNDVIVVEKLSGNWTDVADGSIVSATYKDQRMVKIFYRTRRDQVTLFSANLAEKDNEDYAPIEIDMVEEQSMFGIRGIVKYTIKSFKNNSRKNVKNLAICERQGTIHSSK